MITSERIIRKIAGKMIKVKKVFVFFFLQAVDFAFLVTLAMELVQRF
jgi:hypothetical protein